MLLTAYFIAHLLVCVAATKPGGDHAAPKKSKAGISWPVQELTSDPAQKFFQPGSKLSWHYNWNKNYDRVLPDTTPGLKIDGEFVPMFFTTTDVDNGTPLQEGYKNLMGFNEPDLDLGGVAQHVSEKDAAAAWAKISKLRQPGQKLISPGVASNLEYMKLIDEKFMEEVHILEGSEGTKIDKPDYINVHVYANDLQGIKDKCNLYHDTFGLPIWVTEFAMHSFDGGATPPKNQQSVHDFMGQVTKWMDETPWIERYAWFGAVRNEENLHGVHPFNRLMTNKGELTALGHQYVGGGHK